MMPAIEAAEQTVLQRAIPFERQGRVFGFAQMVEDAAAPVTAIAIGPLTEVVFMPLMTAGSDAAWIGRWFGTGSEPVIAVLFTLPGVFGVRSESRSVGIGGVTTCRSRGSAVP